MGTEEDKRKAVFEAWLDDVRNMSPIPKKVGLTLDTLCSKTVVQLCEELGWQGMPMGGGSRTVKRLCRIAMMYDSECLLAKEAMKKIFVW